MYADLELCGQIFASKDKSVFAIKCLTCEMGIEHWDGFVCHLQNEHQAAKVWADPLDPVTEVKFEKDEESKPPSEYEMELSNAMEFIDNTDEPTEIEPVKEEEVENSSSEDTDEDDSDEHAHTLKLKMNFHKRNSDTMTFIELYKNSPQLWNPSDENYNNAGLRKKAEKDIIDALKRKHHINLTPKAFSTAIEKVHRQYKRIAKLSTKLNTVTQEYMQACSFLENLPNQLDYDTTQDDSPKHLPLTRKSPITTAFIQVFKDHPALYDPSNANFTNINERKTACEQMANTLETKHNIKFSALDVQKNVRLLRHWYYKIKNRHTQEAGTSNKALYVVQKFYLEKCSFLPASMTRRECSLCKQTFRTDFNLTVHLYKAHKIGEPPYKCTQCERSFDVRASLVTHEKRSHIGKVLQCEYCEQRFAVKIDLDRHTRTHTGEKRYVCEWCGKSFLNKTGLGYHMDAIHTKTRAYKCNLCPKDFLKKRDLDDHMKAHFNIRDKICQTCGKGFTNCHSLIRHRQIHSEVKKFECKMCDAKFHQFVGLNSHMKRVHNIVRNQAKTTTT